MKIRPLQKLQKVFTEITHVNLNGASIIILDFELDEIEVDTICNIQKSVPESEMMKPEETSDSQVVIEESRVMFQKNSYENQHFRLGIKIITTRPF